MPRSTEKKAPPKPKKPARARKKPTPIRLDYTWTELINMTGEEVNKLKERMNDEYYKARVEKEQKVNAILMLQDAIKKERGDNEN